MIGAITGDIVGSIYEFHNNKSKEFEFLPPNSHFTDDTVLTVALADTILTGIPYEKNLKTYYAKYPYAGYGGMFRRWALSDNSKPYNSFGNGAAMRISPAAYQGKSLEEVLKFAELYTGVTHNHPEGIKGAQATAAAIFLARTGSTKEQIKSYIEFTFQYDLSGTVAEMRKSYSFDVSCQGTVPPAIVAFLEGTSFEDTIRNAISMGGDSDTLACIAGGMAEAFFGIPSDLREVVIGKLDPHLASITRQFMAKFMNDV